MLKETLTIDLVTTELAGRDKNEIIKSMLDLVCNSGKVKDPAAALKAVLDHEAAMSTGMENGIAIPHAKTDAVDELVAAVGVSKRKIDFENLDRKPAQIFIMTLSPMHGTGLHVQFLADISRLLKEASIRKQILKAKTDEELLAILTS